MNNDVEQIKERLDLASLIGEYVPLKPAGQNLKGLCPFHQEKSPSFMVSPARGSWHCFGCDLGGDVFTFIQKIEGLDFPATLKMLAERAGVTLKKTNVPASNYRQRLFDVMQESANFYQHILLKLEGAQKVRTYLEERGVKKETMELFSLGYAPMQWNLLQNHLAKKGMTLEEMLAAGVVIKNERGKTYDRFRGRIIFPVQDTQGRVVAFGARIVPWHATGNEGKYINSPETALYEKRRVVYNLNRAKQFLRGDKPCLVVEGYMDVIMLAQAGLTNVVASSGTAFTEEHIQQLSRFTKTLHFAFDGDSAGWKATIAATSSALMAGMQVATVMLPEGQDPADLARQESNEVQAFFAKPASLISLLINQLQKGGTSATQADKLQAMLPLLKTVKNPIVQGQMVQDIAQALHVPEQNIHRLLTTTSGLALDVAPVVAQAEQSVGKEALAEWRLLGLLLLSPEVRAEWFPKLTSDVLLDPKSILLYNSLQHVAHEKSDFFSMTSSVLIADLRQSNLVSFAQGALALAEEFLSIDGSSAPEEAHNLFVRLRRRQLTSRLNILQQELSTAGSSERNQEALRQFQRVAHELSQISTI